MTQTIRLTYDSGLTTPKLFLWDAAGDPVGKASGYALTETPAGSGHYVTTVADGLSGSPLTAELEVDGTFETSDSLFLSGEADSVAVVGVLLPDEIASASSEAVWTRASRTLTGFGSLVSDIVSALRASIFGSGDNIVTVTVEDGDSEVLSGKRVNLFTSAGVATGVYDTTDENGQVEFVLANGDYKLGITATSGFEPHTPEALEVDGAETPTLTLTRITISSPPAAGLCTVYTYAKINGVLIEGATIEAKLLKQDSAVEDTVLSMQKVSDDTDAAGYAELFLVQASQFLTGDGRYHITVRDATGKTLSSFTTTIPDEDTRSVQQLLTALEA